MANSVEKYQKGSIVKGVVSGITGYGIFVKIDSKYDGLIHISEISDKYVKNPKYFANINDVISAKIIDIDEKTSHIKLSIKSIEYNSKGKKKRIIETKHGFSTLEYKLPFWIDDNLKKAKNVANDVDK